MLSHLIVSLIAMAGLAASTAATPVSAADRHDAPSVGQQVETFVRAQAAAWPGKVQLAVDASRIDSQAACTRMEFFLPGGSQLRSRMSIGVRCTAPRPWVAFADAQLSINGRYYVAARNVKAGAALAASDLAVRTGDLLSLPSNVVFAASQIVGRIATQQIRANTLIRTTALRGPDFIRRGQTVRLVAQGAGFIASASGRALQDGAPGTQIKVRTGSGHIVSGTIVRANTVKVIM